MSLYDFHMYLKYIEMSSENLEFYIWFKNYQSEWVKSGSVDQVDEKDYGSVHSATDSTTSIVKPERTDGSFDETVCAADVDAGEWLSFSSFQSLVDILDHGSRTRP
jgi:hypothetical protein